MSPSLIVADITRAAPPSVVDVLGYDKIEMAITAAVEESRNSVDRPSQAELLPILDRMAQLPKEACPNCGRMKLHHRCSRCGNCQEYVAGASTCTHPDCGATANRYNAPLKEQEPAYPFARKFSVELAEKIRGGITPSRKQVDLAMKLSRETGGGTRKPTTMEKDAIDFVTDNMKAWKKIAPLLGREFPEALSDISFSGNTNQEKKDRLAAAKVLLRRILYDATGWERFPTLVEWHDALKVIPRKFGPRGGDQGPADKEMDGAINALMELHAFIIQEKWATEPLPAR